jgi:hypothetical protein
LAKPTIQIICIVVLSLLLSSLVIFSYEDRFTRISYKFIAYGADSVGNDIYAFEVYQYNGSVWNLVVNNTASGNTSRIHDAWATAFRVGIKLNKTLASSDAEAISFTRCNLTIMNITDSKLVWTNVTLNNTATIGSDATYYYHWKLGNWTTDLPLAGVSYNCTVYYDAYY